MTLTTEQLRERIGHLKERLRDMKQHKYPDDCPNATAYLESLKAERQQDIALLEELLANREAQPVMYASEETLAYANEGEKSLIVWSGPMGDAVVPLFTAPPAPAVPDESDPRDAFESVFPMPKYVVRCGAGYAVTAYSAWGANDFVERWEGWNACRAAMLAQPVSQGYKLVPVEPTLKQWAAGVKAMDTGMDKVTLVYKAMLATAPTQGENQ